MHFLKLGLHNTSYLSIFGTTPYYMVLNTCTLRSAYICIKITDMGQNRPTFRVLFAKKYTSMKKYTTVSSMAVWTASCCPMKIIFNQKLIIFSKLDCIQCICAELSKATEREQGLP